MESCSREAYKLKPTMILSVKGCYEDRIAIVKHNRFSVRRGVTKIALQLRGSRRDFLEQINNMSGHKREVSCAKSASRDSILRAHRDISVSRYSILRATTQAGDKVVQGSIFRVEEEISFVEQQYHKLAQQI